METRVFIVGTHSDSGDRKIILSEDVKEVSDILNNGNFVFICKIKDNEVLFIDNFWHKAMCDALYECSHGISGGMMKFNSNNEFEGQHFYL